jgi:hypothetical protein
LNREGSASTRDFLNFEAATLQLLRRILERLVF